MPNRRQQEPPRGRRKQPRGPGTFSPDDDETAQSEETLLRDADREPPEMEDQPEADQGEREESRH
jgi:hypothetical protein